MAITTDRITDLWHPGGDPQAISDLAAALRALAEDCRTQAQAVTGPFMRLEWKGGARDAYKERLAIITGDRLTLDGSRTQRPEGLLQIARIAEREAAILDNGAQGGGRRGIAMVLEKTQRDLLDAYREMSTPVGPLLKEPVLVEYLTLEITYDDTPALRAVERIEQYRRQALDMIVELADVETQLVARLEWTLDELKTLTRTLTAPIAVPGQWSQIEVEYGPLRHFCESTLPDVVNRLLTAAVDLSRSRRTNAPIPYEGLLPDRTPTGLLAEMRRTLNATVGRAAWALVYYTEVLKDGMRQRWPDRPRLETFQPRVVPADPLNSDWDTQWDAAQEFDRWNQTFQYRPR